jgi:hypothetical protein
MADRVDGYLGGWHSSVATVEMGPREAVGATLFYYRHSCSQAVTGMVSGSVSPPSSNGQHRQKPIAAVLACEVPSWWRRSLDD